MFKKKKFFITFEGIEGSGKSFQSYKLFKNLQKIKIPTILTREPGGSKSAESIRKIILSGKKNKFDIYTDTLLYIAARNEHIKNTIKPAILKKKIIICDRFTDSTIAYQVYGRGVNKNLVDLIHKNILGDLKPNLTIILKIKYSKVLERLKKRKIVNRYDKFSKNFYLKVQRAFIKIAKTNKKRYIVFDSSSDCNNLEKVIFAKVIDFLKK